MVWIFKEGALALTGPRVIRLLLGAAIVVASIGSQPAMAATQATGGVDSFETTAGVGANGSAQVFDRSNSSADSSSVGATSQPKNVTTSSPGLLASFAGLNHFDERFGSSNHGNQFSLEPPDQGLCVGQDTNGNVRVVEALNDVFQVYDTSGKALIARPRALNEFFGDAPSIIRGAGPGGSPEFGPFITDPSCLYDAATQRWFVDVLTLDTFQLVGADGQQHFVGTNHLDIAVSQTADPTGAWNFFHIDVTDDGTDNGFGKTPDDGCSTGPIGKPPAGGTHLHACLGDYPHIGSNADSVFLTTNEYSLFGNEFHGALIYAMSKASLEGGAPFSPTRFNTHGMNPTAFALNGFTLWPSSTPTDLGYGAGDKSNGGTEYFLSSNAAAEAHDTGDGTSTFHPSTELLVWSLDNTSMLDTNPAAVILSVSALGVGQYTFPPQSEQKSGNQPLRDCLNNNPCSTALEGIKDPFAEKSASLDSNDTRMQQVTWVNGSLWGALDTGLDTSNGKQAGIEWFKVSASGGSGGASLANSGYVGLGNDNLTYPAIGITTGGTGVMAFTVVGTDFYPSAGYATIDGSGVSDIHIAAAGQGPDDGFTDYRLFANGPSFTPRPRWGDYGAAVPWGGGVWLASEYIGQSCDLSTYERTVFRCDNTRTALANWGTRISEVSA
ncbi:MAG TPA: hypothetical protein VGV88_12990 [Candidatus Dormibacteraeota bacterium]|nr:hypothetical protein [Candidatus Dormibacteraeota bacterium]